ncbi:protein D3-like [Phlebotomus argentipes]|uniref:protein D3-like n=1 Tax=Phlebotomus argentipes TaxID=94469 RepID=UPI002892B594|nr:protein D3-like [Phlebotomus argentipes]
MKILVVFLTLFAAGGWAFFGPDVPGIFRAAQIVPNVIPVAPQRQLEVIYERLNRVSLGEELTPSAVRNPPVVVKCLLCGISLRGFYTLVLIDPDAPSRDNPFEANFLHFMAVNIPGHRFTHALHQGETVAEYMGAIPGQNTGHHRYIFLLYRQRGGQTLFDEPRIPSNNTSLRRNFALDNFVARYSLDLAAGNFFQAAYDSSVNALSAQFVDSDRK